MLYIPRASSRILKAVRQKNTALLRNGARRIGQTFVRRVSGAPVYDTRSYVAYGDNRASVAERFDNNCFGPRTVGCGKLSVKYDTKTVQIKSKA
jgi:hypothetical protein